MQQGPPPTTTSMTSKGSSSNSARDRDNRKGKADLILVVQLQSSGKGVQASGVVPHWQGKVLWDEAAGRTGRSPGSVTLAPCRVRLGCTEAQVCESLTCQTCQSGQAGRGQEAGRQEGALVTTRKG
jgi:hypothetical protein